METNISRYLRNSIAKKIWKMKNQYSISQIILIAVSNKLQMAWQDLNNPPLVMDLLSKQKK